MIKSSIIDTLKGVNMKTTKELFDEMANNVSFSETDYDLLKEKPKEVKRYIVKLLTDFNVNKINYFEKYKNRNKYIFPIMLATELKIQETFPLILKCFELDNQDAYYLYEEFMSDISSVIYHTFDENVKLLESFINNDKIDEQIRNSALMAYFKLTSEKLINKRVFNNFVNKKLELMQEEPTDESINLLTLIADLSCENHIYSQLLIVRKIAYSSYFDETLAGDYEHYIDKMFTYDESNNISNIITEYNVISRCYLYRLYDFSKDKNLEEKRNDEKIGLEKTEKKKEMMKNFLETCTITKPKDITKNDLCFCGSGLKYKKCCMGKRDVAYVYKRLEDYYDLLIDYPEVENPSKEQKGLVSFFSKEAIEMDKLFYKALHKVSIPNYIPHNYSDERLLKASYLLNGLDIASNIIKDNNAFDEEMFNTKYMIHYDIFSCINEAYKIIHDEHYPLPQLNQKIKDLIYSINKFFKGSQGE